MKALTIWQPWASLKACGAKQFETRGWATAYRGPIAIHSAKKRYGPYSCELPVGFTDVAANALWPGVIGPCVIADNWDELPLGAVIATGELIACHQIVSVGWTGCADRRIAWVDENLCPHYPSAREVLFGDWSSGRYAWEIVNVRMLPEPIPVKGKQGLWNWDERGMTA